MTTETLAPTAETAPPATLAVPHFSVGDRVEVWFDGWDTWQPGTVEQVGRLDCQDCVAVRLGQTAWASVYPVGRVRRFNPATRDLQTTREPLGGLFVSGDDEMSGDDEK